MHFFNIFFYILLRISVIWLSSLYFLLFLYWLIQYNNDIKANVSATNKAQAAADKAQATADSKVDQSKYNLDKAQTNAAVQETKDNLNTFQKEQDVNNKAQRKDI